MAAQSLKFLFVCLHMLRRKGKISSCHHNNSNKHGNCGGDCNHLAKCTSMSTVQVSIVLKKYRVNTSWHTDGEFYSLVFLYLTPSLLLWLCLALVSLIGYTSLCFLVVVEGFSPFCPHPSASSERTEIWMKWTQCTDRGLQPYPYACWMSSTTEP